MHLIDYSTNYILQGARAKYVLSAGYIFLNLFIDSCTLIYILRLYILCFRSTYLRTVRVIYVDIVLGCQLEVAGRLTAESAGG
jgi:hypothetical protein